MKTLSILLHFVMILFLAHTDAVACSLNPTAKILTDPEGTVFYHGNAVVLDGSTSTANCGSIDQYRWQIDDVTVSWSSVYSHTFNLASGESERVYKVQLRVRNTAGKYGYKTIYVTVTRNNKSFYYLTDHLGSVRVTVNEQGDPVGWDDYYPFGLTMPGRSSNSGNPNDNYKYIGEELDDEAGLDLYNLNARTYDPVIGRFLQIDPLFDHPNQRGLSPYNYSWNNPVSLSDPTGLCPRCEISMNNRVKRFLDGNITRDQYLAETRAEGKGAVLGASIVFSPIATAVGSVFELAFSDNADLSGAGARATISDKITDAVPGGGKLKLLKKALAAGGAEVLGGSTDRALSGEEIFNAEALTLDFVSGTAGGAVGDKAGSILLNKGVSRGTESGVRRGVAAVTRKGAKEVLEKGAGTSTIQALYNSIKDFIVGKDENK